jgi:hypothetical protein
MMRIEYSTPYHTAAQITVVVTTPAPSTQPISSKTQWDVVNTSAAIASGIVRSFQPSLHDGGILPVLQKSELRGDWL